MRDNLAATFFVEPIDANGVSIEELHANFWVWARKRLFVDLGLILNVPLSAFDCTEPLVLRCHLQMRAASQSARSLDRELTERHVAQWLFNDSLKIEQRQSSGSASKYITLIRRSDATELVILSDSQVTQNEVGSACTLELNLQFVSPQIAKEMSKDGSTLRIYTRFQYRIDPHDKHGHLLDKGIFRDHLLLDGRFNDVRAMPADIASGRKFLHIPILRLFLIHPLDYSLTLQPPPKSKQYERLLEHGANALRRYFHNTSLWRAEALIHQWMQAREEDKERGYNVLLVLDCEKGIWEKFLYTALLLLLAVGAFCVVGYNSKNEEVKSIGDGLIALIIAVSVGLLGDILVSVWKLANSWLQVMDDRIRLLLGRAAE